MSTPQQKNELVIGVLRAATKPLGPTEIGRRICPDDWRIWGGCSPTTAAITPILRRINAVRHAGGKYTSPLHPSGQAVTDVLPVYVHPRAPWPFPDLRPESIFASDPRFTYGSEVAARKAAANRTPQAQRVADARAAKAKEKIDKGHEWRVNGPLSIAGPEKLKTKPGVGRNASA